MVGNMAQLIWAPIIGGGGKTTENETYEETVESWIEQGCKNEGLSSTLQGRTNMFTGWAGSLQERDQGTTINKRRAQEIQTEECYMVNELVRRNDTAITEQVVRTRMQYEWDQQTGYKAGKKGKL